MLPAELSLSAELGEALLRTLSAAHEAANAHQYFVWQRLHLHRFVPHELALCAIGLPPEPGARVHLLHCVALPAALIGQLQQADSPFWRALRDAWRRAGGEPAELQLGEPALAGTPEAQALMQLGFRQVLVHGSPEHLGPAPAMLHAFARTGEAPAAAEALRRGVLRLCLPSLHFAALRAFAGRDAASPHGNGTPTGAAPLSQREVEVLQAVRAAKHNAQIGEQLGISPLTVKNHLRKIMRKLGATNRAQAVGEAMARGLLR